MKLSDALRTIKEHAMMIVPTTLDEAKHQIRLYKMIACFAVDEYEAAKAGVWSLDRDNE